MAAAVELVCFDLGGVLIRICRSWAEGCRAAGIEVCGKTHEDLSSANGWRDLGRLHQTGRMLCAEYFRAMAASSNGQYQPRDVERIHDAWMLGEYPGVGEVIDRIHCAGLTTAALSNTNARHWRTLPSFPSVAKLTFRLASHELGMVKPDEAIYREAERRFGVSGGRIVFFDDLADNVAAARALGWRAVQVDHAGDTAKQIDAALRGHGVD